MTNSQIKALEEITQGAVCCTLPFEQYGLVFVAPLGELGGKLVEIGKRGSLHFGKFQRLSYYL